MRKQLIAVAAALLATAPALASGFSIFEQSAKASGQAGAWVARADDAAANWYNPAALVKLEGTQVQFGFNYIDIGGDTNFTIGSDPFPIGAAALLGVTVTPGQRFESESNVAIPSHLYFTGHLNEDWAYGIGLTVPFGLVTEWKDLPLTLVSQKAELMTLNINPNLAYKINDNWSVAFGLNYLYADIAEFSRFVPLPDVERAPIPAGTYEFNLKGNGDDLGWNAAIHYAGPDWNFGFTYRDGVNPDIGGTAEFTGIEAPSIGGDTTLNLPAQAAIGVAYTALPSFDIEFDVSWARWSTFKSLIVQFDDGSSINQAENWSDTLAFRIGGAWRLAEAHEIRLGLVRDQNPIPDNTLRPSIPDADRTGLSFGYGFAGKKFQFDGYGMMLKFDDRNASGVFGGGAPSPYDGVIDGTYRSKVLLLGLTAGYKF
ncbi:MAG TPA: outer membrane protein transport protein [Candidatus Polarisedimenticolaceae bacterium]